MVQVQCPHCDMFKVQTLQVQTIERAAGDLKREAEDDSWHVLVVLVLTLTIVGLPLAYVLCKYFEREERKRAELVCEYSYRCRLCNYEWVWRTDKPLPQRVSESSLSKTKNSRSSPVRRRRAVYISFLNELVAWWFKS
jgi:hypothetical protein